MKTILILTVLMAALVSEAAELKLVTGTAQGTCPDNDEVLARQARQSAESSAPNCVRVSEWQEKVVYPATRPGTHYRNVDEQGCEQQKVATARAAFLHVKQLGDPSPWSLTISTSAITIGPSEEPS